MSSLSNLSETETIKSDRASADVTKVLNSLIESHKSQAKNLCFVQHSSNHENFIACLNDKFKSIEIYTQAFRMKLGFENLAYTQCLETDSSFLTPEICLRDMETRCYKHLKDFGNIL